MTELLSKLHNAGFTGTESKVYIAILELGNAKAADLIKSTRLHRNLVYQALESLITRHLVSKQISKSCAVFVANDPVRLMDEHAAKGRNLENLIADLQSRHRAVDREVVIYEGIEGIARSTEHALQQTKSGSVYIMGGTNVTNTSGLVNYWKKYHTDRVKRKIWANMLFCESTDKGILEHRNKYEYTDARYMPVGLETPSWFHFVDDITIIQIPSGKTPLSIFTKSKDLADTMKMYFDYIWKQTVPFKA